MLPGKFGLSKTLSIIAGTTDGCAAFLASGASEPGDGVTSLGTTLTLKLLSDRPVFSPEYGIYSHRIGDQWLAGGASNSGGGVLRKYFSSEDIARLSGLIDPDVPTGLDYYPLPQAGERFPIADPNFEPRLSPRPDDDRLFFLGLLEGIAHVEGQGYRAPGRIGGHAAQKHSERGRWRCQRDMDEDQIENSGCSGKAIGQRARGDGDGAPGLAGYWPCTLSGSQKSPDVLTGC